MKFLIAFAIICVVVVSVAAVPNPNPILYGRYGAPYATYGGGYATAFGVVDASNTGSGTLNSILGGALNPTYGLAYGYGPYGLI